MLALMGVAGTSASQDNGHRGRSSLNKIHDSIISTRGRERRVLEESRLEVQVWRSINVFQVYCISKNIII